MAGVIAEDENTTARRNDLAQCRRGRRLRRAGCSFCILCCVAFIASTRWSVTWRWSEGAVSLERGCIFVDLVPPEGESGWSVRQSTEHMRWRPYEYIGGGLSRWFDELQLPLWFFFGVAALPLGLLRIRDIRCGRPPAGWLLHLPSRLLGWEYTLSDVRRIFSRLRVRAPAWGVPICPWFCAVTAGVVTVLGSWPTTEAVFCFCLRYAPYVGPWYLPRVLAAFFAAALGVTYARLAYRAAAPIPGPDHPACRNCGYNLTGNLSGVCPECGTLCGGGPDDAVASPPRV